MDAALIAGDLGCFPDPSKFDKATKRWIDRDPEEAGFAKYFTTPVAEVERLFEPNRGILRRSLPNPVRGGKPRRLRLPCVGQQASPCARCSAKHVSGRLLQAVPLCPRRGHCYYSWPTQLQVAHRRRLGNRKHPAEAPYKIKLRLSSSFKREVNSHSICCSPMMRREPDPFGGSALITQIIRTICPDIHLFGHVHPIQGQYEFFVAGSKTKSLVLENVSFGRDASGSLSGAMGILDWDGYRAKTVIVKEPWLQQMHHKNWDRVWPECVSPKAH